MPAKRPFLVCKQRYCRQKRISRIEKVALVIIFGIKVCHWFIHGSRFRQQTDHRQKKGGFLLCTANILQSYGTIVLNYESDLDYLPTEMLGYADSLSKLLSRNGKPFENTVTQP